MPKFGLKTLLALLLLASITLAWFVDRGIQQRRIDDLAVRLFTSEETNVRANLLGIPKPRPDEAWESYSNLSYAAVVMRDNRRVDIQLLEVVRTCRESLSVNQHPSLSQDLSNYARSILTDLGIETSDELKHRLEKRELISLIPNEHWSGFVNFLRLESSEPRVFDNFP